MEPPAVNINLLGMSPEAVEQSAPTVRRRCHDIAVHMPYQYCSRALMLLRRRPDAGVRVLKRCYAYRRVCAGASNIHTAIPLLLRRNPVPEAQITGPLLVKSSVAPAQMTRCCRHPQQLRVKGPQLL
jgi:hypothetical protein